LLQYRRSCIQFKLSNPYSRRAHAFTGRLNVKFKVQSRQLNSPHPDQHYTAAFFNYIRQFAIHNRLQTVMLMINQILSLVSLELQWLLWHVHGDVPLVVADHDTTTKCKITPSTVLNVEIPQSIEGSFYRDVVLSTLKDTIFQPYSPMQHSAEMMIHLGDQCDSKLLLIIYSDCVTHRVTYPSVQLALPCWLYFYPLTWIC
jgi:hypothetical protein